MDENQDNRYSFTETEAQHVSQVRNQMGELEAEVLRLEGATRMKEREIASLRRHLQLYLGSVATGAGLPAGAQLSPDGAALVAREQ